MLNRFVYAGAAAIAISFAAGPGHSLQLTQLTFGVSPPATQSEFEPAWAPDGSRLACSVDIFTPGAFESYWFIGLVGASGGAMSELHAEKVYYNQRPTWSPDGTVSRVLS